MKTQGKTRGRPSRYRPEYAEKARTLAEVGLTQEEIAHHLDVHPNTLRGWMAARPRLPTRLGPARRGRINASKMPFIGGRSDLSAMKRLRSPRRTASKG